MSQVFEGCFSAISSPAMKDAGVSGIKAFNKGPAQCLLVTYAIAPLFQASYLLWKSNDVGEHCLKSQISSSPLANTALVACPLYKGLTIPT